MAVTTSYLNPTEKRHWWLTNRRIVEKYIKDARSLIATQKESEIISALSLVDAALAISPRLERALELRATCLLFLRRFKDVADMLQDYIPSLRMNSNEDSSSSSSDSGGFSSQNHSREGVKLLSSSSSNCSSTSSDSSSCCLSPPPGGRDKSFTCFSVSELKKKVMAGICKTCDNEGHWKYLVVGKACFHLGLMEDAMVLLQTGKRLATAAFRRQSICWSDDSFSLSLSTTKPPPSFPLIESESITHLLSHIKLLLRRRAAALAALDAGLHTEAIRHFSKIIDSRRSATPQSFLSQCYAHRASAHRQAWRIADAIADCNRALALEASCIEALQTRALVLESIRCVPECLHDLEHLKLLYNSILRDRKLPGPAWKHHNVRYVEIPGRLCTLSTKIKELKQRVANGETGNNVDYYALISLRRGCSRSELQRAHLLLCLKHKHEKALNFIDRCELADERDIEDVKERAKMSSLLLYRLIQKGYGHIMANIMEDEEAALEEQKKKRTLHDDNNNPSLLQGGFCRDVSQSGFNSSIPMNYEALTC